MKKILLIGLVLLAQLSYAQSTYKPTKENLEARKWFSEAKFGLFVHWGVYSVLGDGEWVMENEGISIESYDRLPAFFNPIDFNAKAWVQMAKKAGMKYITVTSRHHDGFSMFDSNATDYNIVKKTPFKRDVLKELAEACQEEGIRLFFYYSLVDWHRDDYYPRGTTGKKSKGRGEGKWENYIAFMKEQLTELLTNYGEIAGIWFDGHWDKKDANWHFEEIYDLIHDLQPQCLIGNNHHGKIIAGEDFQMFEKDLPGEDTKGFGAKAEDVGKLPKEVCETISSSWGFRLNDDWVKSKKELIQLLVTTSGYGSNLLLNVDPMPNGKIKSKQISTLKEIGEWLEVYGETIYGTQQGIIPPSKEMVSTQKGKRVYLHILKNKNVVFLPEFKSKVKSITTYKSKNAVPYEINKYGLLIKIPKKEQDPIDTIIEIQLK